MSLVCVQACAPSPPRGGVDRRLDETTTAGVIEADRSSLGRACVEDAECGHDERCYPGQNLDARGRETGACGCVGDEIPCDMRCVDLAIDAQNCGGCGAACLAGSSCIAGQCVIDDEGLANGPLGADGPALTVDPPVLISGGTPGTSCDSRFEAYPDRALVAGTAQLFVAHSTNSFNYAAAAPGFNYTWSAASAAVPGSFVSSDAWATASSLTGRNYVSFIYDAGALNSIGVASASPSNFPNAAGWENSFASVESVNDADLDDGPSIYLDDALGHLYAVSREINGGANVCGPTSDSNDVCLRIFRNCGAGQVGGPACPQSTVFPTTKNPNDLAIGHATVTVSPSTHNAIVAYRTGNDVILRFYTPLGAATKRFVVRTNSGYAPASPECDTCNDGAEIPKCSGACSTDCAGEQGCVNILPRVHVATKFQAGTGRSFAYVAYDELCGGGTSTGLQFTARLDIVDITNENAPQVVRSWAGSDCTSSDDEQTFMSTSTASLFSSNVGFFFYRMVTGDPCYTIFTGMVDGSLGLAGMSSAGTISGPFPMMRFPLFNGFTHYNGIVKGGLPGGYLYPSWTEPVPTSSNSGDCLKCQTNQRYNRRIMAARVLP